MSNNPLRQTLRASINLRLRCPSNQREECCRGLKEEGPPPQTSVAQSSKCALTERQLRFRKKQIWNSENTATLLKESFWDPLRTHSVLNICYHPSFAFPSLLSFSFFVIHSSIRIFLTHGPKYRCQDNNSPI